MIRTLFKCAYDIATPIPKVLLGMNQDEPFCLEKCMVGRKNKYSERDKEAIKHTFQIHKYQQDRFDCDLAENSEYLAKMVSAIKRPKPDNTNQIALLVILFIAVATALSFYLGV